MVENSLIFVRNTLATFAYPFSVVMFAEKVQLFPESSIYKNILACVENYILSIFA